ncbi:MAG TPA: ATP-dependent DNA ligase [Terriglobales bacterium]|nr:ATP-dependent DNA ligase [Terriglobales bacterium]
MGPLSTICEAIAATTKKTEKVRLLSDYFRSRKLEEAAISAVFLSGRAFPTYDETTLQVGGSMLWEALRTISQKSESEMTAAYRRHGDAGAAAYDLLVDLAPAQTSLNVIEVVREFRQIAETRRAAVKATLLRQLLSQASALEVKYLVKIIAGDLRIGLRESLVEEAIAKAYGAALPEVQRANMLLGDIGETLRLAAEVKLNQAHLRLFHPIGFMLASPAETADEAFQYFEHAVVEDKYDGIRAQAHVSDHVRLYSRTLGEITNSFPELNQPLASFPDGLILDGEVLAWQAGPDGGRPLPFSQLQQRLGRKKVSAALMRQVPVAYVVFDVLYADGELLIDRPLRERAHVLDRIFAEACRNPRLRIGMHSREAQGQLMFGSEENSRGVSEDDVIATAQTQVLRAPATTADSSAHLEELFEQAMERGNEGLMIKDIESAYTPGRRGRSWLKLKRELATLDVVVTAVEFGHGKRAGVLSDYTFAVRAADEDDTLLNVGKAYSGLTDAEITGLTQWFLEHTVRDEGFRRQVEPKIVIEVAFNAVMVSDRHNSGYALRFPRIVRLRPDKRPEEVDTLDRVREIYERQKLKYPEAEDVGTQRESESSK